MNKSNQNRTVQATKAAAIKASKRREELREIVRLKVFSFLCECGRCRRGDYGSLCKSRWEIARTLNTLSVPTSRGITGGWQVTSVKRLFSSNDLNQSMGLSDLFDD